MTEESKFVGEAQAAAELALQAPLFIQRHATLLYQVTVDNNLELSVDPKKPKRGDSGFQTDLCVFEEKSSDVVIPRVVLEFKGGITTHDVLTYSAKARKHKQVYPYLRYGLIVADVPTVPRRVFVHNESLDFFAAMRNNHADYLQGFFARLISVEVEASRKLESIAFGEFRPVLYRSEVQLDTFGA